jgi:NADH-quinone oxidoreductase subunit C
MAATESTDAPRETAGKDTAGLIAAALAAILGEAPLAVETRLGEVCIVVKREAIVAALQALRDAPELRYEMLIDIAGVDYPERPERFEIVYQLLSLTKNQRLRVKVATDETTPVPSVAQLYPAAGWYERECWDLFGVSFSGHPDLRRILTDYGFEGHPLRKDFPLTGYVEVRYDELRKSVIYEPVQLPQDFRTFDFVSPWEGMTDVQKRRLLPGDEKATVPMTKTDRR